MEIICKWLLCFVIARGTEQCGRVQTGSKEQFAEFVLKNDWQASDVMTSECVKKGEQFKLNWGRK